MNFLPRSLNLNEITKKKSVFLLGPRQTGKSSLIKHSFSPEVPLFNLLDRNLLTSLSANPSRLRQQLVAKAYSDGLVVIDEIQKLPELLDEVHLMIETMNLRFLLTGSSARKLRRAGTNLLGGRARRHYLHPLTSHELGPRFDLLRALNCGTLPSLYFSDEPRKDLRDYVGLYLDEEINAEAAVRQLSSFSRFLSTAALCNGQLINYSTIASDAQEKRQKVHEYFDIMKDTLFGDELPAWKQSKKRKPIETSKFYIFDVGIARAINDLPFVKEKSKDFGDAFEHFVWQELRAYVHYRYQDLPLNYWRSTSNYEVDFILGDHTGIEVKAKATIGERDLRGIRALKEEKLLKNYVVVCLEENKRRVDDILIVPWQDFFTELWADAYVP